MANTEQKAMELMAQAQKKATSSKGFFGSLMGGSSKQEEASELYVKAANTFKMAKKWAAAGEAFCCSAKIQQGLGNNHEAATNYVDAGNCYRKTDPNEAVTSILKAIEIYTDMGRFTIAAKHNITIAEIYETELIDIDKAIAYYEQAADYYKGEESNSSANKCSLKVAHHAALQEQYDKAIQIYEQVATSSMDNQLLRYSAKDYFFRASICRMCQEVGDAATSLNKYEEMFPAFSDSRECKLIKALLGACEEQNADAFSEAVAEYDKISRLDQWHTTLLLRVKKAIEGDMDLR